MDASRRASGYDLFKLLIAIILLILFLRLWMSANQSSQPVPVGLSPTGTLLISPSATSIANPIAVPATATSVPLSPTSIAFPSPTMTIESAPTVFPPTPTATNPDILTTPPTTPTPTPMIEPASTPPPPEESPSASTACEAAESRSRLRTGMQATILRRLNFRSSPGIRDNWLLTNRPGTRVEVVGGPECLPHYAGAYVWWQIRLPDGKIGWSAEGSIHGTFYFMEPAK